MKCEKCGAPLDDDKRVCLECGAYQDKTAYVWVAGRTQADRTEADDATADDAIDSTNSDSDTDDTRDGGTNDASELLFTLGALEDTEEGPIDEHESAWSSASSFGISKTMVIAPVGFDLVTGMPITDAQEIPASEQAVSEQAVSENQAASESTAEASVVEVDESNAIVDVAEVDKSNAVAHVAEVEENESHTTVGAAEEDGNTTTADAAKEDGSVTTADVAKANENVTTVSAAEVSEAETGDGTTDEANASGETNVTDKVNITAEANEAEVTDETAAADEAKDAPENKPESTDNANSPKPHALDFSGFDTFLDGSVLETKPRDPDLGASKQADITSIISSTGISAQSGADQAKNDTTKEAQRRVFSDDSSIKRHRVLNKRNYANNSKKPEGETSSKPAEPQSVTTPDSMPAPVVEIAEAINSFDSQTSNPNQTPNGLQIPLKKPSGKTRQQNPYEGAPQIVIIKKSSTPLVVALCVIVVLIALIAALLFVMIDPLDMRQGTTVAPFRHSTTNSTQASPQSNKDANKEEASEEETASKKEAEPEKDTESEKENDYLAVPSSQKEQASSGQTSASRSPTS